MRNENEYQEHWDPWDQGTYQTGNTRPPKSHGGVIAALLVIVILLCGIVSVLGLMNIRLFKSMNLSGNNETIPVSISYDDPSVPPATISQDPSIPDPIGEKNNNVSIHINQSPLSVDNIPQEGGLSLQDIYANTIDSVVSISCSYRNGSSSGTGVVLTSDGYIVTNCHVVEDSLTISVRFTDERVLQAQLIGADAISDLAVLKVEADDLSPAQLGDSSSMRVGDAVVAIGDPLGVELRGTMTNGIVSAINRDIQLDGRTMTLIQTNAALNSGNSGGPLLNCYGQVIGINTMKIGDQMNSGGVEGLGFAIPSTTVKEIVDQLITQGYVSGRPYLGITGESISPFYQLYYRLPEGLYINAVSGSVAAAGIEAGDILISIDGIRITTPEELETALYAYSAGDTVQIIIYRGGQQFKANVTVDEAN